jgi:diguanylate cyclase (GGDEF)-like protein
METSPGTAEAGHTSRRRFETLTLNLILVAVYYASGKLGLRMAVVHPSVTPVWPPTGISFAALLVFGYRLAPGVFLGAFLVDLTTSGAAAASLGIATGNMLEALIGVRLINRFGRGRQVFDREPDILRFGILAGMGSTIISATIGVLSLTLAGLAEPARFESIWSSWWLGDLTGNLVFAPPLVLWSNRRLTRWRPDTTKSLLLLLCLLAVSIFGEIIPAVMTPYILFGCIPLLLWTAFRFTRRQAATASVLLSSIAIWGTLRDVGPFVRSSPLGTAPPGTDAKLQSLLVLQGFMCFMSLMTLMVAALVAERRRIEDELRKLAVTDSLTGLFNHRRFVEVLNEESRRSQRTGRPFAVLVLDLDGLKRINDLHGHIVGSRALCRLAAVLRATSRSIDTAARFGGDEFGLVLVETNRVSAGIVAERIRQQLEADPEQPVLSVSAGVAVYPDDARDVDALLQIADRALYAMKAAAR